MSAGIFERVVCRCTDVHDPVVIVAAHPDDEVIGMGARLKRLRNATVVYVTDGVPKDIRYSFSAGYPSREAYSRARVKEGSEALALADFTEDDLVRLRFTDQEVSFFLVGLTLQLCQIFKKIKPVAVFTHPYEGGHPDHDSVSFAVSSAKKILKRESPPVYEFTSYHGFWGQIETGEFLPQNRKQRRYSLNSEDFRLKSSMLACFESQIAMLKNFSCGHEDFRRSPSYNYSAPPHKGVLFYEMFDWNMTGRKWRALAEDARRLLGIRK